jgi:hypothetical protein
VAEPQWTLNGRAVVAGDASASRPATSVSDAPASQPAMSVSDPTLSTPIDILLSDRSAFTAEEDAEIQRAMARHKVDREHPVIQVVVEMLLYRRQYRELLAEFKLVAREVKNTQKPGVSLIVQPTAGRPAATGALYALVIVAIGVVAWLAGQAIGETQSEARLRAAVPQVATLLTTRPGQAALGLVRDNGDALPKLLSQCHTFVDRGRDAMSCTLWARGTGVPLTMATPLDHVLATIAAVPAWPVVLLIAIVAGVRFAWHNGRHAAARASRGW